MPCERWLRAAGQVQRLVRWRRVPVQGPLGVLWSAWDVGGSPCSVAQLGGAVRRALMPSAWVCLPRQRPVRVNAKPAGLGHLSESAAAYADDRTTENPLPFGTAGTCQAERQVDLPARAAVS